MDAQRTAIAETCLAGAYDGSLAFPDIIGMLIAAGFDGYAVDYRRNVTTYCLAEGGCVVLDNRPSDQPVAAAFDAAGLAAQIKWAQANPPDYSYSAFCRNVRALGCAGYLVSFPGRRVLYFGRTAETHVEHFPR
ncbi:MAG: DUF1398 domain-containing protein [Ferrovibrionaceae bacterium]